MTSHPTVVRAVATTRLVLAALVACVAVTPGVARAERFSLDLWTGRGSEAVYRPGEGIDVGFKVSEDAHLLVYEIDSEGNVHVLFPYRRGDDFVPGGRELNLPEEEDAKLVVQGPVGEGYIVAIASREPFEPLPWYLRPYDAQAEELGYYGDPEEKQRDEENVTAEGRIVGDPFVAMERIRRRVVAEAEDRDAFATDYTTYYVHNAVRYPRYLCNDCHRPGRYAFWTGSTRTTRRAAPWISASMSRGVGGRPIGSAPFRTTPTCTGTTARRVTSRVAAAVAGAVRLGMDGGTGAACGMGRFVASSRRLRSGTYRRASSTIRSGGSAPIRSQSLRGSSQTHMAVRSIPGARRTIGRGGSGPGSDRAPVWVGGNRSPRREGGAGDGTRLGNPRGESSWGRSGRASGDDNGSGKGRAHSASTGVCGPGVARASLRAQVFG